jgi:hypothetical protein
MKRRLLALTLVASFLYSTSAVAELKFFPMWERMQCGETEFACYTFEQSQTILKLDLDLQEKLSIIPKLEQNIIDLKLSLEKRDKAFEEEQAAKVVWKTRFEEKDKTLTDTSLLYQKAKQRDVFGGALPWVIATILVIGAAAFVGGFYTHAKL